MSVLRRLASPGNGVLSSDEQVSFDASLHEVMSEAAGRVSRRIDRSDWANVRRDLDARGARRRGPPGRVDEHLRRLTTQIDRQVDAAEALAPGVDWSFAQPDADTRPAEADRASTTVTTEGDSETVTDLEQRLTEQVELVQVMSEIAEVSKRTYALEQQRDLQTTRGLFFGFVVSVAVLIAGWAPIVAADDWTERGWILGLTVATCVTAAMVYGLVRSRQERHRSADS